MQHIVLSTGKEVYAFGGIVGIRLNGPITSSTEIYYGHDGRIMTVINEDYEESFDTNGLTKEECIELSNTMIEAWTRYRDSVERET